MAMSQPEMADTLGVHAMTLSKWEREVLAVPKYIALALEAIERRHIGSRKLVSKQKPK